MNTRGLIPCDEPARVESSHQGFSVRAGGPMREHAEDWKRAREVMSACEIARLGVEGIPAPGKLQPTIERWLTGSEFRPTPGVLRLASEACRLLAKSDWLKQDSPQLWKETLVPLKQQLEAAVAKLA